MLLILLQQTTTFLLSPSKAISTKYCNKQKQLLIKVEIC